MSASGEEQWVLYTKMNNEDSLKQYNDISIEYLWRTTKQTTY